MSNRAWDKNLVASACVEYCRCAWLYGGGACRGGGVDINKNELAIQALETELERLSSRKDEISAMRTEDRLHEIERKEKEVFEELISLGRKNCKHSSKTVATWKLEDSEDKEDKIEITLRCNECGEHLKTHLSVKTGMKFLKLDRKPVKGALNFQWEND